MNKEKSYARVPFLDPPNWLGDCIVKMDPHEYHAHRSNLLRRCRATAGFCLRNNKVTSLNAFLYRQGDVSGTPMILAAGGQSDVLIPTSCGPVPVSLASASLFSLSRKKWFQTGELPSPRHSSGTAAINSTRCLSGMFLPAPPDLAIFVHLLLQFLILTNPLSSARVFLVATTTPAHLAF